MDNPACPFCATAMTPQNRPEFAHVFHLFVCDQCHSQLKQFLLRAPEAKPQAPMGDGKVECPDCAFSDVSCFSCDDPVCDSHVRTIERYSSYFNPGLRDNLVNLYGGRIYCPLCFQATVKRHALSKNQKGHKKHFFNFPLILGILSLCLVLVIAAKRCTPPPPQGEAPRLEINDKSQ